MVMTNFVITFFGYYAMATKLWEELQLSFGNNMQMIRFFSSYWDPSSQRKSRLVKNFAEFITLYKFSDYFLPGNGWVVFFLILCFVLWYTDRFVLAGIPVVRLPAWLLSVLIL